jgi:hypothetical protein
MKLCCLFTLSHYPPGHPSNEQKVNCLGCGGWWKWEGQKDGWRPHPDDERRIPEMKKKAVLDFITKHNVSGEHHKNWLLDQIVRKLTGKDYEKWVKEYEQDGEYAWDTGTPP